MPRLRFVGARLYYAALYLYPPAFRREFSSEMAADFDEATHETRLAGRRRDLLALWTSTSADLARTLVVQWLRTGLPVLFLCAATVTIVAAGVAANVLPHEPFAVPATAADRDLLTLMMLTGVVLLVVCATIVFTFWFSRPLRRLPPRPRR